MPYAPFITLATAVTPATFGDPNLLATKPTGWGGPQKPGEINAGWTSQNRKALAPVRAGSPILLRIQTSVEGATGTLVAPVFDGAGFTEFADGAGRIDFAGSCGLQLLLTPDLLAVPWLAALSAGTATLSVATYNAYVV